MSSLRRAQHVLVAEPRANDLEVVLTALASDSQLHVSHGRTGDEAIAVLQSSGRQTSQPMPSLLLLDLAICDPPAIELIRKLRACLRTNCMPIVVLAEGSDRARLPAAYDAGANSCLIKPESTTDLGELVQRLARYWLQLNQLPHHLGAAGNGN